MNDRLDVVESQRREGDIFAVAIKAFDDPNAVYEFNSTAGNEDREQVTGRIEDGVLIALVVYVSKKEKPMARKSTPSSQQEKLVRVSAGAMRKPLTKKQRREVEALIAKPDSEIDFSDIPETVGTLYKPLKRHESAARC